MKWNKQVGLTGFDFERNRMVRGISQDIDVQQVIRMARMRLPVVDKNPTSAAATVHDNSIIDAVVSFLFVRKCDGIWRRGALFGYGGYGPPKFRNLLEDKQTDVQYHQHYQDGRRFSPWDKFFHEIFFTLIVKSLRESNEIAENSIKCLIMKQV